MPISKAIRTSTTVKRLGTPVYQGLARGVVHLPGPRILANSPPKAGTHVLSTLLSRLPQVMFSGRHHNPNEFRVRQPADVPGPDVYAWESVRKQYAKVRPGQFATGHFPATPEFQQVLRDLGMRTVVIFRDPRDMVVSAAFYIRALKRHPLHDVYRGFSSVSEAIDAAIAGVGPFPDGRGHPPIADRIASYLPWLDAPDVLTVRFEDLVGAAGGGSTALQRQSVAAVASHVGRPLDEEQLQRVCDRVFAPGSATFRKGQIGDWRNHLTGEQVDVLKERLGTQLIRLGYESDHDW
jgi:hypothetical protein